MQAHKLFYARWNMNLLSGVPWINFLFKFSGIHSERHVTMLLFLRLSLDCVLARITLVSMENCTVTFWTAQLKFKNKMCQFKFIPNSGDALFCFVSKQLFYFAYSRFGISELMTYPYSRSHSINNTNSLDSSVCCCCCWLWFWWRVIYRCSRWYVRLVYLFVCYSFTLIMSNFELILGW